MNTKICSKCEHNLPLSAFYKRRASKKDGLNCTCKKCVEQYQLSEAGKISAAKYKQSEKHKMKEKRYYNSTKGKERLAKYHSTEKVRKANRDYQRNRPENEKRDAHYKSNYGISLAEYDEMFERQNGNCAICGLPELMKRLEVDHCHATGQLRGLLCGSCNLLLGKCHDSLDVLRSAVNYLERAQKKAKVCVAG